MGTLASELVRLSGPKAVHGIIPNALIRFERNEDENNDEDPNEKINEDLTFGHTTRVPDMHSRKRLMVSEVLRGGPGSGFVALSGGYGTLEELMEITTWNQLNIHSKPIILFNVEGYWDGLLSWIRKAAETGFVREGNAEMGMSGLEYGQTSMKADASENACIRSRGVSKGVDHGFCFTTADLTQAAWRALIIRRLESDT